MTDLEAEILKLQEENAALEEEANKLAGSLAYITDALERVLKREISQKNLHRPLLTLPAPPEGYGWCEYPKSCHIATLEGGTVIAGAFWVCRKHTVELVEEATDG